jgi:hypothetical protein
VECDSAARLAWRVRTNSSLTHFSPVALRRRLSPGLPLSPTSVEARDPAVLLLYYPLNYLNHPPSLASYYSYSWATILHDEESRPHVQLPLEANCGPIML